MGNAASVTELNFSRLDGGALAFVWQRSARPHHILDRAQPDLLWRCTSRISLANTSTSDRQPVSASLSAVFLSR